MCEECGGKGIDPGSLLEPEPCIECNGTGKPKPYESVFYGMRKDVGREIS
jgi:DnaJ-class molecular chaperone